MSDSLHALQPMPALRLIVCVEVAIKREKSCPCIFFDACHAEAQGATLVKYAVYLEKDCFSHGQFYTAITRGGSVDACGIRVPLDCVDSVDRGGSGEAYVRNVVDPKLLLPSTRVETIGGTAASVPRVARTTHESFAEVQNARKSDFRRSERRTCMCCDGGGSGLIDCYCCENAVHERCAKNTRLASASWADPVCLHEHFSAGGDNVCSRNCGFFVCPQCYNDYHELARASQFADAGYLDNQGVAMMWEWGGGSDAICSSGGGGASGDNIDDGDGV